MLLRPPGAVMNALWNRYLSLPSSPGVTSIMKTSPRSMARSSPAKEEVLAMEASGSESGAKHRRSSIRDRRSMTGSSARRPPSIRSERTPSQSNDLFSLGNANRQRRSGSRKSAGKDIGKVLLYTLNPGFPHDVTYVLTLHVVRYSI